MKKLLIFIQYIGLFSVLSYGNTCPRWLPIPMEKGLTSIVPIYPQNIKESDLDCDAVIDRLDDDIDGDGVLNSLDIFPRNGSESIDSDGDGLGNNADQDDDNDGVSDREEIKLGTNTIKPDSDNDGINDGEDAYPLDSMKDLNFLIIEDADEKVALKGSWSAYKKNTILPSRKYIRGWESGTVEINLTDINNYYILKIDNSHNIIQWDINMSQYTSMYVVVNTLTKIGNKIVKTKRILHYKPVGFDEGEGKTDKGYIKIGIGKIIDKKWHTIRRDLISDLQKYDSASTFVSVESLFIRGKCHLDNIEMLKYRNYENGLNTQNWKTYENSDEILDVTTNEYDQSRKKYVIKLSGNGMETTHKLKQMNNVDYSVLQWSMKYSEEYEVCIEIMTAKGKRYLCYDNSDYTVNRKHYTLGLGVSSINGKWVTQTRDLTKDLREFEKDNVIISVKSFLVRGSGLVDNISLLKSTRVEDDPTFSHMHYEMGASAVSVDGKDFYVTILKNRHHKQPYSEEALVLHYKKVSDSKWLSKIVTRSEKGIAIDVGMNEFPGYSDKLLVRYSPRTKNNKGYYKHEIKVIDTKNTDIIKNIILDINLTMISFGNILIEPSTKKILISGYSNGVHIRRSNEGYDDTGIDKVYRMDNLVDFENKKNNKKELIEFFAEPVLSYVGDKLVVAIRKEDFWFDERNNTKENFLTNINGELKYIPISEVENTKRWTTIKLDNQIHGMYMPAYQEENFSMIVSDGGNRQNILGIKSYDITQLNSFISSKLAYIKNLRGGGYPTRIKNDTEDFMLYWEETNDPRRTKIVQKNTPKSFK